MSTIVAAASSSSCTICRSPAVSFTRQKNMVFAFRTVFDSERSSLTSFPHERKAAANDGGCVTVCGISLYGYGRYFADRPRRGTRMMSKAVAGEASASGPPPQSGDVVASRESQPVITTHARRLLAGTGSDWLLREASCCVPEVTSGEKRKEIPFSD